MSFAKVGDVIVPDLLLEALPGAFAKIAVLRSTGALIFITGMPAGRGQVGSLIKVPNFGTVGDMEILQEDGQALTPVGISMSADTAMVKHAGKAIEASYWAQASVAENPYTEMSRQLAVSTERLADAEGVAAAIASPSSLTLNVSGTGTTLDYDTMIEAKMLWGDEQDSIAALVVHSKVKGDLYKLKDSTGRPLFQDNVQHTRLDGSVQLMEYFAGVPVVVSDRMTSSGGNYTSLLLKKNSIVFWLGEQHVLTDKDILADTDVAALHLYYAALAYSRFPGGTRSGVVKIITK